jgi:biopolymer transport protein ExbD
MTRHRRPTFHVPVASFQPIATINTTPLIDLMLVLIIMFIVTIPLATHKVPLDLPAPRPTPQQPVPVHRLSIDLTGHLSWDGRTIAERELGARLAALVADPAMPDLHLDADAEARFERVDQVLAQVKRAGVTRLGFLGNSDFVSGLDPS